MDTRVRLLGAPEVVHGGTTHALRAERRFQLLAVLAVQGRPVERDWLATLFWPERDTAAARRNLRKLVFDSQALPFARGIESKRATLAWRVATDVAEFEAALEAGRGDEALGLYRGPLCEGLDAADRSAFDDWLAHPRRRLAARWRSAVLARAAAGPPAAAIELAQRLLAADPLDEEAVAMALRAHQALDQTAAALRLYVAYKQVLAQSLAIEPSATLRRLAHAVEAGRGEPAAPGAASLSPYAFVGRDAELRELAALLAREECRVLTIIGPGGVGKSQLAKAALDRLEPHFEQGIAWIPLDDLDAVEQVPPRVVQVLDIDAAGSSDLAAAVASHLAGRRMLLVLDNAEPVRRLTAWIDRLLAAAPALKVLATSRRRLGASGEWLLPLEGLAVPPTDAQPFAGYDAVRLFELRARAAHPPFDLPAQAASVARLVRRLGGLPLAIELAAPWVRLLPVHEIELEVASSLDILAQEQDGDERPEHRSVRATFEQSWRLLAPAEQRAFAALSVFVGSFSRLAAKDVAAAPLALLNALADKSLIRVDSEGRIGLHPLLVQFGRDKLRAQGDDAAFAAAHREWYARWLAQRRDALQNGQREALDEVQRELANCLVAWRGLIVAHDSERIAGCAAALMYFLERRQRFDEGAALLKEAADRLGADREGDRLAAAEVLRALGQLHYRCGRTEAAVAESRRALRLFKAIKQREGIKRCLGVLGLALWQSGAYVEAKRCFDDALRRARADGDAPGVATFVGNVGLIEQALGNDDRALALFGEALQRNQDVGDLVGVGNQYINLGNLHRARHEVQQARRWYEEGRAFAERHGHLRALPWFSINLALIGLDSGELTRAQELATQALEQAREAGNPRVQAQALLLLARLALQRADFRAARAQIRDALAVAAAMNNEPIQLDCIARHGQVLAAEGSVGEAAALWSFVALHPKTEASQRREAIRLMESVPPGARAAAPRLNLSDLAQRIGSALT